MHIHNFLAGAMLLQGDYHIPQNKEECVRLIKLAADNGHIATMLHKGINGVSKNVSDAVHYLDNGSRCWRSECNVLLLLIC